MGYRLAIWSLKNPFPLKVFQYFKSLLVRQDRWLFPKEVQFWHPARLDGLNSENGLQAK